MAPIARQREPAALRPQKRNMVSAPQICPSEEIDGEVKLERWGGVGGRCHTGPSLRPVQRKNHTREESTRSAAGRPCPLKPRVGRLLLLRTAPGAFLPPIAPPGAGQWGGGLPAGGFGRGYVIIPSEIRMSASANIRGKIRGGIFVEKRGGIEFDPACRCCAPQLSRKPKPTSG